MKNLPTGSGWSDSYPDPKTSDQFPMLFRPGRFILPVSNHSSSLHLEVGLQLENDGLVQKGRACCCGNMLWPGSGCWLESMIGRLLSMLVCWGLVTSVLHKNGYVVVSGHVVGAHPFPWSPVVCISGFRWLWNVAPYWLAVGIPIVPGPFGAIPAPIPSI